MRKETSGPVLRPLPYGGGFHSPFAASTNFGFSGHFAPAVNNNHPRFGSSMSHSVRFSIDHRSGSSNRSSISASKNRDFPVSQTKKPCTCSPTTHPGSFRCSLHKNSGSGGHHQASTAYSSSRLNVRRSAMTNSLVRIGGVEGDWVKRALTALIRPSSHQQRRRANFRPRPSRLSAMSNARDH